MVPRENATVADDVHPDDVACVIEMRRELHPVYKCADRASQWARTRQGLPHPTQNAELNAQSRITERKHTTNM